MTGTLPSKPKRGWLLLGTALLALALGGALWLWHNQATLSLADVEQSVARVEAEQRSESLRQLGAVETASDKSLASAAISKDLLNPLLAAFVGVAFTDESSGVTVTLTNLETAFAPGFPRLKARVRAEKAGVAGFDLDAVACFMHRLTPEGVELQVRMLGFKPDANLPGPLRTILSAAAVERINAKLPPFAAPLPREFIFKPEVSGIEDFWVPTANGRVLLHADVPAPPPLTIRWAPVAEWFDENGLHAAGRVSTTGETPVPLPSARLPDADLDKLLANHRLEDGQHYRARVPKDALLAVLQGLNQRSDAERTVSVRGVNQEGQLMEKTGGLPFGNGFKASLEGPERLQVRAVLSGFKPAWRPSEGIGLTANATANGSVQVHVHGNPPRIKKRINLGLFSWKVIDVEVGGGVGSSIGASAQGGGDITASLHYDAESRAFAVRIDSPSKIRARLDIGGVPDDLERWLKAGFDVALPTGKDLYRFNLPETLSQKITLTMPRGAAPPVKIIEISVPTPQVTFRSEYLEVSGAARVIEIARPPATDSP